MVGRPERRKTPGRKPGRNNIGCIGKTLICYSNNCPTFGRARRGETKGYVSFAPGEKSSTKALYAVYQIWCEDNAVKPLSARSFSLYLVENADRYGLEASNSIHITGGKRVRGFIGIKTVLWVPV